MNNKKFSLGISLSASTEFYEYVFKKYNHLIEEVYFSPNLGLKFQSRTIIQSEFNEFGEEKLINILNLAKQYNINLELAINSNKKLTEKDVLNSYLWCKNNNLEINSVVTFNRLIDFTYMLFGKKVKYICSYNENLRKYEDLYKISNKFDEVVIGNNFIRDTVAFSILKEKGFNIRLLLNNGCSHNCLWCSTGESKYCDTVFYNNLKRYSIEELIAKQSVFPYEIKEFYDKTGLIDSYKISNRGCPEDFIKIIIDTYFNDNFDITNKFSVTSTILLINIGKYIIENFDYINFDKVLDIKNKIIKDELNKIEVE